MNQPASSIADVLNFVNSFHEQCRNLVRDAVRILRDESRIYLTRKSSWDYADKPNDRFLDQDCSCIRRCWSAFIPSGDISRGALFHFEFFHPHRRVTPALMYGAFDPGPSGFDSVDRWAAFYATTDVEKGLSTVRVSHDGPITVVTGSAPKRFVEVELIRVPLELITDQSALSTTVVAPLAALLLGDRAGAIDRLASVATEHWPSALTTAVEEETEEDDPEQA